MTATASKIFTGIHDAQGHSILSREGLGAVRGCINARIQGRQLPGISVRHVSPHDLDSRLTVTEPRAPGERVFEVRFEIADPAVVVTVLLVAIDAAGAELVSASLDDWLSPVADIEHQLGDVQAVAADGPTPSSRMDREDRADLRDAERRANAACDRIRAITGNPRNWRLISEQAALYAVAEIAPAEVTA